MIVINNDKAIEIVKSKIREWRESEFKKNDISLQNAIVDNDEVKKQECILRRDYLRDLTSICDGKNVEELKVILSEFLEEQSKG